MTRRGNESAHQGTSATADYLSYHAPADPGATVPRQDVVEGVTGGHRTNSLRSMINRMQVLALR